METPTTQNLSVPIAIVIAGAMIALALYLVGGGTTPSTNTNGAGTTEVKIVPVASTDHILGNPNAPIKIVEYTDLECPFCKQFHATMKQIMAEYGESGKVAWVIRNFPLEQLHPNAPKLAEAAECIAELGGNDAYWKFLDTLFAAAPGNQMTDMTRLGEFATKVGVSATAFNQCYTSGSMKAKVEKEFNDAIASGGQGTPHNIVVDAKGKTVPIPGSQPYATVKSIIDTVLQGK